MCHRASTFGRRVPIAKAASYQYRFATRDFVRAVGNGPHPHVAINVEVIALMPTLLHADAIGHRTQLFVRVGEHVAHHAPAKRQAGVVDVNAHADVRPASRRA